MDICVWIRMEITFMTTIDKFVWGANHLVLDQDKWFLRLATAGEAHDPVLLKASPGGRCSQSNISILDEKGDGSLVVNFATSSASMCWFSRMVKTDPSIRSASLEYSEGSCCFVGNVAWDRSTNTLTETYRSGDDLTDDDWFILGHDKCPECDQFLCEC